MYKNDQLFFYAYVGLLSSNWVEWALELFLLKMEGK